MTIVFVTQKSSKIGVGHYIRSNLVKQKIKISSYFILNNKFIYNKKKFSLENIKDEKIKEYFKEIGLKIIYFDIHIFNNLHKRLFYIAKTENIKIIFYDQYNPIVKKADMAFFTPSFNVIKKKFYPRKTYAGWNYILLSEHIHKYKTKNKKKFDIIISFGGSDPNCLTEFFIKFLLRFKFNLKVCCIIGSLNKKKKQIKKLCNNSNGMIKFYLSKKKIYKYLNKSKFAIISVGLTSYETIFFNIPAFFIPIKQIDVRLAQYFESLELGISSPFFKNLNFLILENKIKYLINKKKFKPQKKIIDCKGLERVVRLLTKEHENS
jgi:spore coat polysaccharide biosynthesis predicted glycosyltransferase SpsG